MATEQLPKDNSESQKNQNPWLSEILQAIKQDPETAKKMLEDWFRQQKGSAKEAMHILNIMSQESDKIMKDPNMDKKKIAAAINSPEMKTMLASMKILATTIANSFEIAWNRNALVRDALGFQASVRSEIVTDPSTWELTEKLHISGQYGQPLSLPDGKPYDSIMSPSPGEVFVSDSEFKKDLSNVQRWIKEWKLSTKAPGMEWAK